MKGIIAKVLIGLSIILILISVIIIGNKASNNIKKENEEQKYITLIEPQDMINNDYINAKLVKFDTRLDNSFTATFEVINKKDEEIALYIINSHINYLLVDEGKLGSDNAIVIAPGEKVEQKVTIDKLKTEIYFDKLQSLDIRFVVAGTKSDIDYYNIVSDESRLLKTNFYDDITSNLSIGENVFVNDKIEIQYVDTIFESEKSDSKRKIGLKFLFKNKSSEKEYLWVKNSKIKVDDKEYTIMYNGEVEPNRYALGTVWFYSDEVELKHVKMAMSFFDSKTYKVKSNTEVFEFDIKNVE